MLVYTIYIIYICRVIQCRIILTLKIMTVDDLMVKEEKIILELKAEYPKLKKIHFELLYCGYPKENSNKELVELKLNNPDLYYKKVRSAKIDLFELNLKTSLHEDFFKQLGYIEL